MNYLEFKKKIILSTATAYNLLFFETNLEEEMDINVSIIKVNGIPFACIFGSSNQLETIMNALPPTDFQVNVTSLFDADAEFTMLPSEAIKAESVDTVNLIGKTTQLETKPANTTLDELLQVLTNGNIGTSIPVPLSIDLLFNLLPSIYLKNEHAVLTNLDLKINFNQSMNLGSPQIVKVDFIQATPIEVSMNRDATRIVQSDIYTATSLSLKITKVAENNVGLIFSTINGSFEIVSLMKTSASKVTKFETETISEVSINMSLRGIATLLNYDDIKLNQIDTLTLSKMKIYY